MYKKISVILLSLFIGVAGALAQSNQLRTAVAGQKYKIKGVIVSKDDNGTFIVRDTTGVDTKIVVAPNASIKSNAFFGGDKYPVTALVRGLNMDVEGVGDSSGAVSVTKVRFDKTSMATAQTVETRIAPAEERLTAQEQNAQRISGQIDELMAISNAPKGEPKAPQHPADPPV